MSAHVLGIGTAVPATALSQADVLRFLRTISGLKEKEEKLTERIFEQSGVRNRYFALSRDVVNDVIQGSQKTGSPFARIDLPEWRGPTTGERMLEYAKSAGSLAVNAARECLERSAIGAQDITHLVTISCTGFQSPGVDIDLIQQLNLPATTERVHVGCMGCHAAVNGLRVVRGLIAAEPGARVLMVSVELCSMHTVQRLDNEQIVASSLFADGAAALVASAEQTENSWPISACGSCVVPGTTDAMSWSIGDHGFQMRLKRTVPELIKKHLAGWLNAWLRTHGLSAKDVPTWCLHPGGPKILDAVRNALGLEESVLTPAREVLAEFGNMSSATILFILERLMRQRAPRPCVALAFGPGLSAEACLFR